MAESNQNSAPEDLHAAIKENTRQRLHLLTELEALENVADGLFDALLARNPLPEHPWGLAVRDGTVQGIDLRLRSMMPVGFWHAPYCPKDIGGHIRDVRLWAGAWDSDLIAPDDDETRRRVQINPRGVPGRD